MTYPHKNKMKPRKLPEIVSEYEVWEALGPEWHALVEKREREERARAEYYARIFNS